MMRFYMSNSGMGNSNVRNAKATIKGATRIFERDSFERLDMVNIL